ncbi:MAG TPA: Holliday junction resolvase RuvX [Candidatus Andersenbacteria bacterium]|nr:Holliday junction resolvase RuvX [Candidatus Andersenbacteria bacterium]
MLCIDFGERYIGLAITDPEGRLALRHSVIDQKTTPALPILHEIAQKERVQKILVGVPVSLAGRETAQTRVSQQFIQKLRAELGEAVEIESVDETLTSHEAAQNLAREGASSQDEHMEAARLMLEEYLRRND